MLTDMKVIVTIKRHNKDANGFCKEIEVTPLECDNLKEIAREVNYMTDNECLSVYVSEV